MAAVHDVAAYILKKQGPLSAMKLQKLMYYSQAWSLVWLDRPLFRARIEAWANGPVVREVYRHHRQMFTVSQWPLGDATALGPDERRAVDGVLGFYGNKSAQWLSDLTHMEEPWKTARQEAGAGPGQSCEREISLASMSEYYGGLAAPRHIA